MELRINNSLKKLFKSYKQLCLVSHCFTLYLTMIPKCLPELNTYKFSFKKYQKRIYMIFISDQPIHRQRHISPTRIPQGFPELKTIKIILRNKLKVLKCDQIPFTPQPTWIPKCFPEPTTYKFSLKKYQKASLSGYHGPVHRLTQTQTKTQIDRQQDKCFPELNIYKIIFKKEVVKSFQNSSLFSPLIILHHTL